MPQRTGVQKAGVSIYTVTTIIYPGLIPRVPLIANVTSMAPLPAPIAVSAVIAATTGSAVAVAPARVVRGEVGTVGKIIQRNTAIAHPVGQRNGRMEIPAPVGKPAPADDALK